MFTRILVPLDGSALSETVLPWVQPLATKLHARVYLLRVVTPTTLQPYIPLSEFAVVSSLAPEDRELALAEAGSYLDAVAPRLGPDLEVQPLVRQGDAAQTIVRVARECGVDMIAMSTHGLTGLSRLVFGSVAEQVVRTAGIPVVVVHPDEAAQAALPEGEPPAEGG